MSNPLLDWQTHPDFEAIEAAHIAPGVEALAAELSSAFDALEASPGETWETLATPYYAIQDHLERIWTLIEHISNVRDSDAWREAYAAALPKLSSLALRFSQSGVLYGALKGLLERADALGLDEAQRRALQKSVQRASLAGVALPEADKARFAAWSQELDALYQRFSNNQMDSIKAWKRLVTDPAEIAGTTKTWRAQAASAAVRAGHEGATADEGPWVIGLDRPSALGIYKECENRALREEVRRAMGQIARIDEGGNPEILKRILEVRALMAEMLGFESYAELSLTTKTAGSVSEVSGLLDRLLAIAKPADAADLSDLQALAAARGAPEGDGLMPWDVSYWFQRMRESRFGLDGEALRPYFPLSSVFNALFERVESLFGVRFEAADGEVSVWHPDVRFFRIINAADGAPLATIYVDPYVRPEGKRSGAWMFGLVQRAQMADGSLRLPVVGVNCNQTPPTDTIPSLMTFAEVRTLFHEFGHALHGALTTQTVPSVAGTSGVEWDVVEVPSTFMENWCYHRPTLERMARHYETGEPLPAETIDALLAARDFGAAAQIVGTVRWSLIDMALHRPLPEGVEPLEVETKIRTETDNMPPLDGDFALCSFGHIFATAGYAAGYYSYLWAEVMSADAFAAFTEADDELAVGQRFRETFLSLGGGRHPADVFRDFRGRDPSPDALLINKGLLEQTASA